MQCLSYIHSDFNCGNVCHGVDILHNGMEHGSIGELHTDAFLVGHHMSISEDETVAADDETRTIGHWDLSP